MIIVGNLYKAEVMYALYVWELWHTKAPIEIGRGWRHESLFGNVLVCLVIVRLEESSLRQFSALEVSKRSTYLTRAVLMSDSVVIKNECIIDLVWCQITNMVWTLTLHIFKRRQVPM